MKMNKENKNNNWNIFSKKIKSLLSTWTLSQKKYSIPSHRENNCHKHFKIQVSINSPFEFSLIFYLLGINCGWGTPEKMKACEIGFLGLREEYSAEIDRLQREVKDLKKSKRTLEAQLVT